MNVALRDDINQSLYLIKPNTMYSFQDLLYREKASRKNLEEYIRMDYVKNSDTILGHYLIALKKNKKTPKIEYSEEDKFTQIEGPDLYVESLKVFYQKYRKEIKLSRDTLYINLCLETSVVSSRENNLYINNQNYLCDEIKREIRRKPEIKKVRFVVNLNRKEYKNKSSEAIKHNAKKIEDLIKKIKNEILKDVDLEQKKPEDRIQKIIDKDLLILIFCKNVILDKTSEFTQAVLDSRKLIKGQADKNNSKPELNYDKQLAQAVNNQKNIFGFFSLCSIHLFQIVQNIKDDLPESHIKFKKCKIHKEYSDQNIRKLIFQYVDPDLAIDITLFKKDKYTLRSNDIYFKDIDDSKYTNLIQKWFKPKHEIQILKNLIIKELNLKSHNTLTVYYRGTDTTKDRRITPYDEFTKNVKSIIKNYKNIKSIYLQTDDKMFEDYFLTSNIDREILINPYLKSEYSYRGQHFTTKENKIFHIQKMIASVLLMSQSEYVICNTCNVSRWIHLYRGGLGGFFQMKGNCISPSIRG